MKKLLFALLVALSMTAGAAPITTGSLVNEMVDMRRLAEFPAPFYKTVQFSSYDHVSSLPGGPGWFGNSDGFGKESIPNFEGVIKEPGLLSQGEYLICDVEGPGAIVRLWTARIEGNIRMYLDGNDAPVYDGPAEAFFMRPWNVYLKETGLEEKDLVGTFYERQAAYCPMPFAKRCRIVWIGDKDRTHFYQVQIRRYDAGTEVSTFSGADIKTFADPIRRAVRVMADPDHAWEYASKAVPMAIDAEVAPGAMQEALKLDGPKAIERLSLRVEAPDRDLALRQTILHIVCDGYPWGQVQSPIGDFFGAAPGVNPYVSVPFSVAPDGTMTCRFVMPCEKQIQVFLENLGEQPVRVRGEALPMDYAWNPATSMHFRAHWRINHGLTGAHDHPQDLPFLLANGAGVYVGTVSYVLNPNEVPSSGGNWWGEGDEKIFSDEDVRPSTFGTGSEDYYNYAWSSGDIFLFPYCGQPRNDGPANRGFVTNNRWHILDPLPFKTRLSFYMELFTHETNRNMAYGRIGYHYGRPGMMDDHVVITREDVRRQELPQGWNPAARAAAKNSVFLPVETLVQGAANGTLEEGALWAGASLYRWRPKAVGEELHLRFPVDAAGAYNVQLCAAQDSESGRFSAMLNGDPVKFGDSTVFNAQDPYRTMLKCIGLAHEGKLNAANSLVLRFEGEPGQSIGLDFLWLQKAGR